MHEEGTILLGCGCEVTSEVIAGENTVTLDACKEDCWVVDFMEKESKAQGKKFIKAYKEQGVH